MKTETQEKGILKICKSRYHNGIRFLDRRMEDFVLY